MTGSAMTGSVTSTDGLAVAALSHGSSPGPALDPDGTVDPARPLAETLRRWFDGGAPTVVYGDQAGPVGRGAEVPGDGVSVLAGRIDGDATVVIGYDPGVGDTGHGLVNHAKVARGLEVAGAMSAAVVLVVSGGPYRAGELAYHQERRDVVHQLVGLSGRVPLVGVAVGAVTDVRSVMLGVCDVVVATPSATVTLDEIAGQQDAPVLAAEKAGAFDLVAESVPDALQLARRYLDLVRRTRAAFDPADDVPVREALRAVVPENPRRAIDARKLIELVADAGSVLPLRVRFGGAIQTALARIGGRSVGLMANHSMVGAGAIDSPAADKMHRFQTLCDAAGIPIVQLTDVPGLLAGPQAEQAALNRHSTRPYFSQVHARVPFLSVILRRAYGQGMIIMGMGGHIDRRPLQMVWPTANFGGMGLGGAAAITAKSSATADSQRSEAEILAELTDAGSARSLAANFRTDELIDPADTRDRLLAAVGLLPDAGPRPVVRAIDPW
ncbi:carboxyl transferase domain-containing protein [Nakamurella leprariae]|uniref:CoA carboxyltransferase C-terminal domain-containing protein n=1 Tax=Nakamurella leprariae TaxID=2803911 RepID=A0A938YDJ3_9ACTN|nr:carboxyl transferase domain-containing protein [Nakamurella leprariae]MBM9467601.1 hypothetical protein [Nakamurella leprariae]